MRFSVATVLAAMASAAVAQQCPRSCTLITGSLLGITLNSVVGTCPAGTTCTAVVGANASTNLLGLGAIITTGVSLIYSRRKIVTDL